MCHSLKVQSEQPVCSCGDLKLLEMLPYVHKQVLVAVGKHPDFPKIEQRVHYDLVVAEVRKYNVNAGIRVMEVPSFEHELEVARLIHSLSAEAYIAKLQQDGIVSQLAGRVLSEIVEILDNDDKPRIKVNALRELEGYVRNLRTLEEKEQFALLVGLKIAVSSFEFFNAELRKKKSPYRKVVEQNNLNRKRINWADLIGGVVNCIGCGVAGGGASGCLGCAESSSGLGSTWFGSSNV